MSLASDFYAQYGRVPSFSELQALSGGQNLAVGRTGSNVLNSAGQIANQAAYAGQGVPMPNVSGLPVANGQQMRMQPRTPQNYRLRVPNEPTDFGPYGSSVVNAAEQMRMQASRPPTDFGPLPPYGQPRTPQNYRLRVPNEPLSALTGRGAQTWGAPITYGGGGWNQQPQGGRPMGGWNQQPQGGQARYPDQGFTSFFNMYGGPMNGGSAGGQRQPMTGMSLGDMLRGYYA